MLSTKRRGIGLIIGLATAALFSTAGGPGTAASPLALASASPQDATGVASRAAVEEAGSGILNVAARASAATPRVRARDLPTGASAADDLPDTAINAYQRAALVLASARPTCHLDWSVLAAIGQIESDHGRSGGRTLQPDGTSTRLIRGVAVARDTDAGQLDGDKTADRAVGPMQFLPSTWLTTKVDGDGDALRSPDDLDDASLATAVYLCAWGDDVSTTRGANAALFRYNRSTAYVAAAVELAHTYREGNYGLIGDYLGLGQALWSAPASFPGAATSPSPHSTGSTRPASHGVPRSHGATSGASSRTPNLPSPARGKDNPPRPSNSTRPSPVPSPRPDPEPAPDPKPAPAPSPDPSPTPTPTADPLTTLSGTLAACGVTEYCLDGQPLGLGALDTNSGQDFDGDGSVETRREELDGLLGSRVTLTVETATEPAVVRAVNGGTW